MRRNVAGLVILILAAVSSGGLAADDCPPPLSPPVLAPPVRDAASELPAIVESTPAAKPSPAVPADRGAILVVPGLTTPRSGARVRKPNAGDATALAPVPAEVLPP